MFMLEVVEFLKSILTYIIIIASVILIRVFLLAPIQVVGDSMEPNFYNGNMLLTEKVTGYLNKYQRFDIIVFKYSNPTYLVKRIIGLPGETVAYKDNGLYINGQLIEQNFEINGITDDYIYEGVIPDDMYFVVGDNRPVSYDSRYDEVGLISKNEIIGKALVQIWPFSSIKIIK